MALASYVVWQKHLAARIRERRLALACRMLGYSQMRYRPIRTRR
jgi:hypothetical protein